MSGKPFGAAAKVLIDRHASQETAGCQLLMKIAGRGAWLGRRGEDARDKVASKSLLRIPPSHGFYNRIARLVQSEYKKQWDGGVRAVLPAPEPRSFWSRLEPTLFFQSDCEASAILV